MSVIFFQLQIVWNSTIRESVVPQWAKIGKKSTTTKIHVIVVNIMNAIALFCIFALHVVKTCGYYYDFSRRTTKMKSKSPEAATWLVSGNCFDICRYANFVQKYILLCVLVLCYTRIKMSFFKDKNWFAYIFKTCQY